jgi:hypothetical protein
MEPLAFQFQDDAAEDALFFEEFDDVAGFHGGPKVTKSPEKSRKAVKAPNQALLHKDGRFSCYPEKIR